MIYARKNKQENGDYIDGNAERWSVIFAHNPFTPARWQRFESEEAALAAWGLTYDPLPEPEAQSLCDCPVNPNPES